MTADRVDAKESEVHASCIHSQHLLCTGPQDADNVARLLLAHGADPSLRAADGSTPLSRAAKAGAVGVVRELTRHGVDPNAETDANTGMTAIHLAAAAGREQVHDMNILDSDTKEGWAASVLHKADKPILTYRKRQCS